MKVPDQIRAILKKGNLNQAALAKELGVSQPTVHRWIKGSEPYGDHLELIRAMYQRIHGDGPEATKGTVPLMGYVGAGAEILPEFEQIPPDGLKLSAYAFSRLLNYASAYRYISHHPPTWRG